MKIIILFFLLIFTSCSNIPKNSWKKINNTNNKIFFNIETGDIILKKRQSNFLGLFGHVGVMKTPRLVVDYPKLGESLRVTDINYWLEQDRDFIILRYIGMNKLFEKNFIEILNKYIKLKRPYKINFNLKTDNGFYCSQFIWFIFYQTENKLYINNLKDDSFLFFPYDFVYSKKFYIVF